MENSIWTILPFVGMYLGALSLIRYDISKLNKKIDDLNLEITELKKGIENQK